MWAKLLRLFRPRRWYVVRYSYDTVARKYKRDFAAIENQRFRHREHAAQLCEFLNNRFFGRDYIYVVLKEIA